MSVMSPVNSNGRKILIPHFILKREWKFRDHFHSFPLCSQLNKVFCV